MGKETEDDTGNKRMREEEREENGTVIVNGRCINSVSIEALAIFLVRERCRSAVVIPGVTCGMILVGVSDCFCWGLGRVGLWCLLCLICLFHFSSVVTEVCDGFSLGSDGESVEPHVLFFHQKACSLLDRYAGRG